MNITTLSSNQIFNKLFSFAFVFFFLLLFFSIGPTRLSSYREDAEDDYSQSRQKMIERDIVGRGIKDKRVIEAMNVVPRHLFVAEEYRPAAYADRPLPIGEDQTISQPYIVALMTELLELKGGEKVLEVGTGSGYQAAVLGLMAREVYTIEIAPSLAERARERLARLGYTNVWVKAADGFYGWEEKGPFDGILVAASGPKIPDPLWRQLSEGGRLVMPLVGERQKQRLVRVRKIEGSRQVEYITGVLFVPMTGAGQKEAR
jgi:protein-L-isoaspartate(D-aspartate) O-methyltransferase